jgi:hypothetical protein
MASTVLWSVAALSWVLSLYLLYRLWTSVDFLAAKLGLSVLLLAPVFGPLVFCWIQSFPESAPPELRSNAYGFYSDTWRNLLELTGKLQPLVQHFKKRRRK